MERKEFKKLQKYWYNKLKRTGFKDIECFGDKDEPFPLLCKKNQRNYEYNDNRNGEEYSRIQTEQRAEYYRSAGQFLHDFPFATRQDRRCWELHCEGKSYRNIAKELSISSMRKVYCIINKYREILRVSLCYGHEAAIRYSRERKWTWRSIKGVEHIRRTNTKERKANKSLKNNEEGNYTNSQGGGSLRAGSNRRGAAFSRGSKNAKRLPRNAIEAKKRA